MPEFCKCCGQIMPAYAERNQQIIAAAKTGEKYKDIAKRFGLSTVRVQQIALKAGIFRISSDSKARAITPIETAALDLAAWVSKHGAASGGLR